MVKRFIDNDFLWDNVSKNPNLLKKAMQTYMEQKILSHPYLKNDAFLCSTDEGIVSVVIIDRYSRSCVITEDNFDLINKVFESNPGKSIRTALIEPIPTVDHFLEAGGKQHIERTPHYKVIFSGDTKEIWTIGGRFRGRVDPDDSRRIQWIQWEDMCD